MYLYYHNFNLFSLLCCQLWQLDGPWQRGVALQSWMWIGDAFAFTLVFNVVRMRPWSPIEVVRQIGSQSNLSVFRVHLHLYFNVIECCLNAIRSPKKCILLAGVKGILDQDEPEQNSDIISHKLRFMVTVDVIVQVNGNLLHSFQRSSDFGQLRCAACGHFDVQKNEYEHLRCSRPVYLIGQV